MFKRIHLISLFTIMSGGFMNAMERTIALDGHHANTEVENSAVIELTKENIKDIISQKDKIIIIDCYADWCNPCKMVKPIFDKLALELSDYIFARLNVDHHRDTAVQFGVEGLPTFVVLKNGTMSGKIVGFKEYATLKERLAELISGQQIDLSKYDKKMLEKKVFEAMQEGTLTVEYLKQFMAAGLDINVRHPEMKLPLIITTLIMIRNDEKAEEMFTFLLSQNCQTEFYSPGEEKAETLEQYFDITIANFSKMLAKYKKMQAILEVHKNSKNKSECTGDSCPLK